MLGEAGAAWQEVGPRIYTFLNGSLEMQVLRVRDSWTLSPSGMWLWCGAGWGCGGLQEWGAAWCRMGLHGGAVWGRMEVQWAAGVGWVWCRMGIQEGTVWCRMEVRYGM